MESREQNYSYKNKYRVIGKQSHRTERYYSCGPQKPPGKGIQSSYREINRCLITDDCKGTTKGKLMTVSVADISSTSNAWVV
jgi:hypothetical protein